MPKFKGLGKNDLYGDSYKMHNDRTVEGAVQRIEEFLTNSESMETQRISILEWVIRAC